MWEAALWASLSLAAAQPPSGDIERAIREAPSFHRLGAGLPTEGQWRNGFDLADLDRDGRVDLVHGPPRRGVGGPAIFLGDGRGGFTRWTGAYPAQPYDYGGAAAGDFDGDGEVDVALGAHLGNIRILRRASEGQLTAAPAEALSGFSTRALVAADWDRDGRIDLIALGEGPAPMSDRPESRGLAVFLNRADGWRRLGPEGRVFGDSIAVGDLDGDGRLDAATASMVLGDTAILFFGERGDGWRIEMLADAGARAIIPAVAVADLDGDGRDDLVAAASRFENGEWSSSLAVHFSLGKGRFRRQAIDELEGALQFSAVAAGDLDGDGSADLVALGRTGGIFAWRGRGRGRFSKVPAPELDSAGGGCRGVHVRLADLTGDGQAEIVAAFADEECASQGSLQVWSMADAGSSRGAQ